MTTNQLIALLFPVGTAVGVCLTALGTMWWVNRRYAAQIASESKMLPQHVAEVIEMLDQAEGHIQIAKRELRRVGPSLRQQ